MAPTYAVCSWSYLEHADCLPAGIPGHSTLGKIAHDREGTYFDLCLRYSYTPLLTHFNSKTLREHMCWRMELIYCTVQRGSIRFSGLIFST